MRAFIVLSLLFIFGAVAAPASADDVLFSCKQATGHATLASLRHVDPKPLAPEEQQKLFQQLLNYYCSGDYMRDITAQADGARHTLEHRVRRGSQKLALVLDIDETSLNNWRSILGADMRLKQPDPNQSCENLKAGCGYNADEHDGDSKVIAPTYRLFKAALARKVSVFFITGRTEEAQRMNGFRWTMRQATLKNLKAVRYQGYTCLFLRPQAGSPEQSRAHAPICASIAKGFADHYDSTAAFKLAARQAIKAQGYTIILNMGDQTTDLGVTPGVDDGTSEVSVLLPNPFY